MKTLTFIYFILILSPLLSKENSGNDYFLLTTGSSKTYIGIDESNSSISILAEKRVLNNKSYFVEKDCRLEDNYCVEFRESFYREENGNIYIRENKQVDTDYLFLPNKLEVNQEWVCFNKWTKLKVLSLDDSLKINNKTIYGLLKLGIYDITLEDTSIYLEFYQRNKGLIAETKDGVITRHLIEN